MKSGHCDYHKGECCAQWLIGDGICQEQNNFLSCDNFDGLDCKYDADGHCKESLIGNGQCDKINIHANCNFDGGDCCTNVLIGNGKCDDVNNFPTCQYYDGGDCRPTNITDWPECPHNPALIGDGICDDHLKINSQCNYDFPDCCPNHKSVGDGECNPQNLNDFCMNDGGDCCNKEIGN